MTALAWAVAAVGAAIAFSVLGVLAGRKLIRRHVAAYHNDVMISLFSSAKVVYAVLLGFLVVVVWEGYDGAHRNVAEEAARLVPLYRLTYGMEQKRGAEMRTIIRDYTQAVIDDEWPLLGEKRSGSQKARRYATEMDRQFARLDPVTKAADAAIDGEFLRTKSEIAVDRAQRLAEAIDHIPWVIWLGALGGGLITAVMSFLIYMERVWPHVLMAGLDGALVGLLLFIMFVLARPFSGPLAIGPDHFVTALEVMNDIDRSQ